MSTLTRRDPFESPALGRLFNNFLNDPFLSEFKALAPAGVEEGTLALDISEDDKNVYVRASLPGFRREDISLEVHSGILSINAVHNEETENKNERFYRKERRTSSVSRRIALPSTVEESKIQADLKDGVLTLRLPKVEREQPKKIKIN